MSTPGQDAPSTTLVGQLLEEFLPFAPSTGPLPDPTPAEGPDPYGNPDPEWLEIDWRAHLHRVEVPMPGEPPPDGTPQVDGDQSAAVNYVEM